MDQFSLVRLLKNFRAGVALACAKPVGRFRFTFGQNQLAELIVAFIAVILLNAYLTTAAPKVFNVYGVGSLASYVVMFFIGAYLVTAIQRSPTTFTAFTVIIISAYLFLYLLMASVAALLDALPPLTAHKIQPVFR